MVPAFGTGHHILVAAGLNREWKSRVKIIDLAGVLPFLLNDLYHISRFNYPIGIVTI